MKNISLEIVKVSYSGEFYFKATSDMVIYIYIGRLQLQYQFNQDFSDKIVSDQILKDGIQFIVK